MLADSESFDRIREDRHTMIKRLAEDNGYPVEKIDSWLVAYNVIDALIHRHLFVDKITMSDQKLVELIQKIYSSIMGEQTEISE